MLSVRTKIAVFFALAILFTFNTSHAKALTVSSGSSTTSTQVSNSVNGSTIEIETNTNNSATLTPTPTPTTEPQQIQTQAISPTTTTPSWLQFITQMLAKYPTMPSSTQSPTLTPTKTPTPTPTTHLTPTPTKSPTITPTPTIHEPSTTNSLLLDSKQQYMLTAINAYRKQNGLYTVQADKYTCSFATIRAKEIVTSFTHDGFSQRINNKTIPYPGYSYITENIAMTSNYQNVVNMWINSPGHAANMRADTPYVCVAYSGNYYAYEGWKP